MLLDSTGILSLEISLSQLRLEENTAEFLINFSPLSGASRILHELSMIVTSAWACDRPPIAVDQIRHGSRK